MPQAAPQTELRPGERWVDNGKVITSAGISAGINASLHVVSKLQGPDKATATVQYMPTIGNDAFQHDRSNSQYDV